MNHISKQPDRGSHMERSAEDWARACELKKVGGEFKGPCPVCGGTDRFHAKTARNGRVLVHCRRCESSIKELAEAAFGTSSRSPSEHWFDSSKSFSPTPRPNADVSADITLARTLWDSATPADDSPAHKYLTGRHVWPESGPSLPRSVRWLAQSRCPALKDKWRGLPYGAAGAIVFLYHRPTEIAPRAVSLDALDENGKRLTVRWRRTFGEKNGTVFQVTPGSDDGPVVLCEGEVTALAAHWLHLDSRPRVWAAGGTSGMTTVARLAPRNRPLVVEMDGDPSGWKTAYELTLARPGVTLRPSPQHQDAADTLGELLSERAAIREEHGGMSRREAFAVAWRDIVEGKG